uniref:Zgc:66484 n=1 Tax=Cyprinus carpio TaxID=7962 RepID=A0A8C2HGR0_CYPCA
MSSCSGPEDAKVVIVGSGFAGLAAAATLVKAGFENVLVLEAKERIGGRVHTIKPFTENIIEVGANWIHGQKGNPLYKIAKKKNLLCEGPSASKNMCQPRSVTPQDYFFKEDGKQVSKTVVDQVCSHFSKLTDKLKKAARMSSCSGPEDAKVVIVGSGFSGLAAAATLVKAGFENVLVLEAKERIGGRVHTIKPFTENIIEVGANWIHGQKGNPLYKIAKEENLLSEGTSASKKSRSVTSEDYFFKEDAKQVSTKLVDQVCSHFSKLTDKAFDEELERKHRKLSLGAYLDDAFGESPLAAGYQAILDVLLKDLPSGTIQCNAPVKSIRWDLVKKGHCEDQRYPVQVVCENGQSFEADHVIVTVSLGVLKDKASTMFEPPLPQTKMSAIKNLDFGKRPEDKDVYESLSEEEAWKKTWFKKITGFDTVARHPTALCGWITGREALYMEKLQDSEIRDICVRSFTGWSVPEVSKTLISRWGSDSHVRGSYTFIPDGVDGVKAHKALASPLPPKDESRGRKHLQVLFAGEATHENFYTTTHGAYLTGVREAERLISYYDD